MNQVWDALAALLLGLDAMVRRLVDNPSPPINRHPATMISDHLNPVFVRDWRQLLHSKGYIIVLAFLYVVAWIILFSVDWQHVHYMMAHLHEPVNCTAYHDSLNPHQHSRWCYPARKLCNEMEGLNRMLVLCAMGAVALLIPLRVGIAVAADTKVKGTNFLQVTPLSAASIVRGLWLSAMSHVLVVAALALPVLAVRAELMPTGNDADALGLLYLVAAGGVFSAAYIFISGLTNFLRFGLMGGLIILGLAAAFCFVDSGIMPLADLPWWVHAINMAGAALVTLLLLQLARRPYAAPAENNTWPVRTTVLRCLLLVAVCFALADDVEPHLSSLLFPICVLTLAACFGALADAILPVTSMPVHALRRVRWLPACIQTPGVLSSLLFLLLPLLFLGAELIWVPESWSHAVRLWRALTIGGQWGYVSLCCVAQALVIWAPVVLSVWMADFFCSRSSDKRPLVCMVAFGVLCIIIGVLSIPLVSEFRVFLPLFNIGEPSKACYELCGWFDPHRDLPGAESVSIAGEVCMLVAFVAFVEALIAASLLWVRVFTHRSER